jgi:cob(I)alamin adenosyltransferase
VIWPVVEEDLKIIEKFTDSLGEPPKKFVRFNTLKSIQYNEARIRCRELETYLVKLLRKKQLRSVAYKYINRLSSLFFMLAYNESK